MSRLNKIKIFLIVALVLVLPFATSVVHAITFEDLVQEGKKLLGTDNKKVKGFVGNSNIEITSDIVLTENGDLNKNGEMDGGDTVRFSFVISNGTDEPYPFSNLKTNIKRDSIHFIHNIKGVTGIDNDTLELPNIYILSHSKIEISFDAQLNYSEESIVASTEKEITSQPLLEDNKKKKLSEGVKKIKKYKSAALENGYKTKLKDDKKDSSVSAVLNTESTPSASPVGENGKNKAPSSLVTNIEEASLTAQLKVSESASPSAQESGNENDI